MQRHDEARVGMRASRAGRSPRRCAPRPPFQFSRRCAVTTTNGSPESTTSATAGSSKHDLVLGRELERVDAGVPGDEHLLVAARPRARGSPRSSRSARGGTPRCARSPGGSAPRGTASASTRVRSPASTWPTGMRRWNARKRGRERRRRVAVDERRGREPVAADLRLASRPTRRWRRSARGRRRRARSITVATRSFSVRPGPADPEVVVRHDPGELEDRLDEVAVLPGRDHDGREPRARAAARARPGTS